MWVYELHTCIPDASAGAAMTEVAMCVATCPRAEAKAPAPCGYGRGNNAHRLAHAMRWRQQGSHVKAVAQVEVITHVCEALPATDKAVVVTDKAVVETSGLDEA